jgi:hypothetical protein
MSPVTWLVLISAVIPLIAAVRANRRTSLIHATVWALAAWAGWLAASITVSLTWSYLAVALTGCAGVAVLGARWPGAAAWNIVVVGLFVVLMLPLAEAVALGSSVRPGTMRTIFLASPVAVMVLNYLPTRLGGAAILVGVGAGAAIHAIVAAEPSGEVAAWCTGLAPWLGWAGVRSLGPNGLWETFRDRYGLVWGLRLRDQFNRAAANAGLPCVLGWTGMKPENEKGREILAALVRRFF